MELKSFKIYLHRYDTAKRSSASFSTESNFIFNGELG